MCSTTSLQSQKRVSDTLKVEICGIVSQHIGSGSKSLGVWKEAIALNCWAISLSPIHWICLGDCVLCLHSQYFHQ